MLIYDEITTDGIRTVNKIQRSIDRLKEFEPAEGYYLAFSGGKDSQVIYHLAKEAGVKFDAHYNITGIDPPELVYFMRKNYPDVIPDMHKKSMWKLIEKKGLPTRLSRFCCAELKEGGGEGRFVVTGVRWAESVRRKNSRKTFEIFEKSKTKDKKYTDDNDEARMMFENCIKKGKFILNPIIDWEDRDIWDYIKSRNLEYCELYNQGYDRLGCIGCPLIGQHGINRDFYRWPRFKILYLKAISRFLVGYFKRCEEKGKLPLYSTPKEWMEWWIYGKPESEIDGQQNFDEEEEDE